MKIENRERLIAAAHRWRAIYSDAASYSSREDATRTLLAEAEDIIRAELAELPREAAHAALDRGINALLDRVLPAPKITKGPKP